MQRRTFLALSGALLATPAIGQNSGADTMRSLSPERSAQLDAAMSKIVADGQVPGLTWLLARDDEVAFGAAGTFEAGGAGAPMARDTIFRIASMTKPVVGVAIMMMVEEGKVRLNDPISRYIPEFKEMKVAVPIPDESAQGQASGSTDQPNNRTTDQRPTTPCPPKEKSPCATC
jgi:CubicO group peptidase (beta-lactamase class C family)